MHLQRMHSVGQFLPDGPIDHLVLFDQAFTGEGIGNYLDAEVVAGPSEILHAHMGSRDTGFNKRLEMLWIHDRAGCWQRFEDQTRAVPAWQQLFSLAVENERGETSYGIVSGTVQ